MPYQIDRYNKVPLTVIADGTVDNTTDLRLLGNDYVNYGEIQNENLVFLLENFAGTTPPPRPLTGQLWFDASVNRLKFNTGSRWHSAAAITVAATSPSSQTAGDFWWDSSKDQLHVSNGAEFILAGPERAGTGITRHRSIEVVDSGSVTRGIIAAYVNDVVVAVYSDSAFTLSDNTPITGFLHVAAGVTLVEGSELRGTAANASLLDNLASSQFLRSDVSATANADINFSQLSNGVKWSSGSITGNNGLTLSSDSVLITNTAAQHTLAVSQQAMLYKGNTVWHAGNHGHSSGLDADTVDGIHGAELLRKSGGTVTGALTVDLASGSLTIGSDAAAMAIESSTTLNQYFTGSLNLRAGTPSNYRSILTASNTELTYKGSEVIHRTITGSGSGLDADTVDGVHGSQLLNRSQSTAQTVVGPVTFSSTIIGNLSGNATTASSLKNSVTINNTTFTGLSSITTNKWGAARTIKIGNTSKTVDGSSNVTWAESEIAANTAVRLKTARRINNVLFDGSSDITITDSNKLSRNGDTMQGPLLLSRSPLLSNEAATKSYVDTIGLTVTYGATQYSTSGFTNIVWYWADYSNYFDVFPPAGKTMANLIAFIPSIAVIYFNGGVNQDDALRCVWSKLGDRVRVWVQNTEQRSTPAANWLAIWR
jgi:hypothetical protein